MEMIKSTFGPHRADIPNLTLIGDHGLTGICISCTSHSEASHVRAGHSSDSLCMVFKCCCKLQHQGEQHSPVVLPLYNSFLRPKAKKCEYSRVCDQQNNSSPLCPRSRLYKAKRINQDLWSCFPKICAWLKCLVSFFFKCIISVINLYLTRKVP